MLVAVGVTIFAEMKGKINAELLTMSNDIQGISLAKLVEWRDRSVHHDSCHHVAVDHHSAANPYQS